LQLLLLLLLLLSRQFNPELLLEKEANRSATASECDC